MTDMKLADAFAPATMDDWRVLVDKALKGADFEKRLVARSVDGIRIEPIYTRGSQPAAQPAVTTVATTGTTTGTTTGADRTLRPIGARAGWDVRQLVADADPVAANRAIIEDLQGGVTSITLRIAAPGQFGLPYSGDGLPRALKDVLLDVCPVALDAGEYTTDAAGALIALWRQAGISEAKWQGAFNYDPLGNLARTGALYHPLDRAMKVAGVFLASHRQHPGVTALMADGRPYHEAGASEAEELAAMLATLVAYLRAAEAEGVAPTATLPLIAIGLAADTDQLFTIAKLRAARRLVARVAEASGATASVPQVRLAVTTSERMLAQRDPWVNMLRTTMATAAAAMGGADSITTLPFTWALGVPDAFARRIARNTHTVLMEESGLDRVVDPAGGSFAIESLTAELAQKSWALFQEIEGEGGMAAALVSGTIAKRIASTAAERAKRIATGRQELTGTSAFPRLGDDGVTVNRHSAPQSADLNGTRIAPLKAQRLAAPFEALRDKADEFTKRTGKPPTVFLASLGPLAVHATRSTWAQNFLAAGGIAAIPNEGFTNSADVGLAFAASGATVACLCSSDQVYGELGEAVASVLKAAGATHVYLAGRPREQEAALKSAGVDDFIFAGIDAVATLGTLHKSLAV